MYQLIELINRILMLIQSAISKKKQDEVEKTYEQINENLKDSITSSGDSNDGVFTPNGNPPTSSDLRDDTEVK